jgi:protein-S-isoprenylcysteine O-methyltransferase Ste14
MSALTKLPCIMAVSLSLHVAHTIPSKAPPNEQATLNNMLERVVQFSISIIKLKKVRGVLRQVWNGGPTSSPQGIFWAIGIAEILTIILTTGTFLSPHVDQRIASAFIKNGNATDLYLTPLSAVGAILVVSGGLVRQQCYRTLKTLFTFEVSIRKDHTLITTGPYGVVRHPSYAGVLAIYIGMYCWWGSRGSWIMESGFLDTIGGKAALATSAIFETGKLGGLLMRVPIEDAALQKQFGEQWNTYARRVPYALFPGIYWRTAESRLELGWVVGRFREGMSEMRQSLRPFVQRKFQPEWSPQSHDQTRPTLSRDIVSFDVFW